MRVFIDTNTYLHFIEYPDVRLQSLDELKKLITQGKVRLVFPQITQDEFYRLYPFIAARYVENLTSGLPPKPAVAAVLKSGKKGTKTNVERLYASYKAEMSKVGERHQRSVKKLVKKIEQLIKKAENMTEDADIIEAAHRRYLRGNPPGKHRDPIGDQIAWEMLLRHCTDDDLTIVSADGDWKNEMEAESMLNPLLQKEWEVRSKHNVRLLGSLGSFINELADKEVIPDEDIAEEKTATKHVLNQTLAFTSAPSIGAFGPTYITASTSPSSTTVFNASFSPSISPSKKLFLDQSGVFPVNLNASGLVFQDRCPQCGMEIYQSVNGQSCSSCDWHS